MFHSRALVCRALMSHGNVVKIGRCGANLTKLTLWKARKPTEVLRGCRGRWRKYFALVHLFSPTQFVPFLHVSFPSNSPQLTSDTHRLNCLHSRSPLYPLQVISSIDGGSEATDLRWGSMGPPQPMRRRMRAGGLERCLQAEKQ